MPAANVLSPFNIMVLRSGDKFIAPYNYTERIEQRLKESISQRVAVGCRGIVDGGWDVVGHNSWREVVALLCSLSSDSDLDSDSDSDSPPPLLRSLLPANSFITCSHRQHDRAGLPAPAYVFALSPIHDGDCDTLRKPIPWATLHARHTPHNHLVPPPPWSFSCPYQWSTTTTSRLTCH